jgi:hypothetical protein
VHEMLVQEFKSIIAGLRGRQSLDTQLDAVVKAMATKLADKPTLSLVSGDHSVSKYTNLSLGRLSKILFENSSKVRYCR